MEKFKYRALNQKGRNVRGEITALNEVDLYKQLQNSGLDLLDYSKVRQTRGTFLSTIGKAKVKLRDLIQLFSGMEQMNSAGVPLLDVLGDMRDANDNPTLRDILSDMHRMISDGSSLSESMEMHSKLFPPLYVSLIRSGEETGDLSMALQNLVKYLLWIDEIQRKIKKATQYPIIVGTVMLIAITVMMGFVVPQIVGFINTLDQEIPWYTSSLIATSRFFQQFWWLLAILPFVAFFAIKFLHARSDAFAYNFDAFVLRVPVIGGVMRKINIARYCQTFSALYSAGVDILKCLKSARGTIDNVAMIEAMEIVEEKVQNGAVMSQAFAMSGEFPSMVIRMLKVGEESGNMSPVLDQVSEFYAKEVDETIQSAIGMIEPSLTGVLGGMIMWIAAGVFGPIYESFEKLNL